MSHEEYKSREQIVDRPMPGERRLVMTENGRLLEQQYTWGRWSTMVNHFAAPPETEE